jgi:hypothetical protein
MSEQNPLNPPKPEQPSVTPPERKPWTAPTLESLDVSETMARVGTGRDGGSPLSTLS